MIAKYILLIILTLMAFSLYKHFSILFKQVENFDSYQNCLNQGYPMNFCLKSPLEVNGTCGCPSGQKAYVRYGRCYCQTYAS